MILTAELSLYPLKTDYEASIINFIKKLKSHTKIEVHTHAMSTFVKGPSQFVFEAINEAMSSTLNDNITASLVMKLINRDLPIEKGFLDF